MPAPSKPGRGASVAAAFILLLFAVPFCGFGMAAFVKGLREITSGGSSQYWGMMMIGLVFSIIGFAFLYALIKGPGAARKIDRRRAENPDQPWLWRDDWAQGRAVSHTKSSMTSAWIWAVLWNMLSVPCLLLVPREQLFSTRMIGVLVFPALGVGFLIWAIRETLRWMEFGKTGAPLFLSVIFSLFWPLIGYMSLEFWLGTSRVTIGNGKLRLQSGWLGGGRIQEFSISDVLQIKTKINGQTGGPSGTPYYDIEMRRRNGPPVTLGKTVRDPQEANWLVSEMTRLAGLKAHTAVAAQP
jgi:hypothetical protein